MHTKYMHYLYHLRVTSTTPRVGQNDSVSAGTIAQSVLDHRSRSKVHEAADKWTELNEFGILNVNTYL